MLRRTLVAAALAGVLSACSAGTAALGPSTGSVAGHVQIRACGGPNRPEQTGCPSGPYAGVMLTFHRIAPAGTAPERTATTDAHGAYRVDLVPGTYSVSPTVPSASQPQPKSFAGAPGMVGGFSGPRQVIVAAGTSVTVDFVYTIQLL